MSKEILFYKLIGYVNRTQIPPHVEFYVGLVCNLRCPYCYLPYKGKLEDELPIMTLLKRLADLGMKSIEILGGEPFIYADKLSYLFDFVKVNRIALTSISTNGTIFDSNITYKLMKSNVKHLQISLDAATEKTYKIVRGGREGLFNRVLENAKKFVQMNMPVTASFVLMKPNISEITQFVELTNEIGIKRISFGAMNPIGEGKNVREWVLTQEDYKNAKKEIDKIKGKYKNIYITLKNETDIRGDLCSAGISKIAVLPNGDLYPCGLFVGEPEFKLGNIMNEISGSKLKLLFQQETVNSKTYWKKCVACKLLAGDIYETKNN
jgi:radical SAM protein with 4Fe4S-binding SPASM domain